MGGVAFEAPAAGVLETFSTEEGTGNKYIVTLGSVVNALKAWFRAGTSFVGFNALRQNCPKLTVCFDDLFTSD